MFTFVTNASARVVAEAIADIGDITYSRINARAADDVTVVEVEDRSAARLTAMLRGYWVDRYARPNPPRGGTRVIRRGWGERLPSLATVRPIATGVASHIVQADVSPEMEALMRRVSRR